MQGEQQKVIAQTEDIRITDSFLQNRSDDDIFRLTVQDYHVERAAGVGSLVESTSCTSIRG